MRRAEVLPPRPQTLIAITLALTVAFVAALLVLTEVSTYETWGALLLAPVLLAISLPVLRRQATREGDARLLWLLCAALVLKLASAIVRHYVAFDVYEGVADAAGYHDWGVKLSRQFWSGNFDTGLPSLTGTEFAKFLSGIVYMFTGPTRLGAFIFFSWIGFWGLFFFYRAFTVAVPEGRPRSYAHLLFFLPSLLYWPSSIGKEAWMTLSLGIGAFGAARALTGRTWRGLAISGLGFWMAGVVRPHMAGMMGVALAVGFLLRPTRAELRQLAPVAKGMTIAAVAVLALVLIVRTDRFLRDSNIDTSEGLTSALGQVTAQTSEGGSAFVPSLIQSPSRAPAAVVTVLFRPFVLEAHNAQSLAAALEGSLLMLICLFRVPWGLAALRSIRRQPYVGFALAYTGIFIFAFSAVANFGILARQRSLLFPLFLVLLCVPRERSDTRSEHVR